MDEFARDATWCTHLTADRGPNADLAAVMCDCYVTEIRRLNGVDSGAYLKHTAVRLSEYLVILYILNALPDEVFELFWDTAPASVRKRAMWFLSTQLELPVEKIPKERRRAYSYWDRRLVAAKNAGDPDYFQEELGAIGLFFFRDGIDPEWLMDQIIAMSEAGFAPDESYSVIDRLAKLSPEFPDRAAHTIASLIKNRISIGGRT
jgi:hypothetical protein